MSKELGKSEAIKKHFYSTNMTRADFEKENWENYGYKDLTTFHRQMTRYGISVKDRSEYFKNTRPNAKIDSFDLDEVDSFGIEPGIGKEYTSARLPEHLKKIGILSDIHVPFHSLEALTCAIKYLREQEIDCLYLNGDTFDFYSISRHEKEKDLRDFPREIEMARNFLQKLRDIFPTIPIYFKAGNHENRFQRYLFSQAEEFAGLHELQFDKFFRLDVLKIEYVEDWQGMFMGDLLVIHGHEGFGVGGINPSQSLFNKMYCNTLMGHVHRQTTTTKKTGFGKVIQTHSTGCLTSIAPKYMPFNQHTQGFAMVTIDEGKTNVKLFAIKDGKIV
jgi:UDP-2,3-diacylglucosamine pyrophosphatase LpxH